MENLRETLDHNGVLTYFFMKEAAVGTRKPRHDLNAVDMRERGVHIAFAVLNVVASRRFAPSVWRGGQGILAAHKRRNVLGLLFYLLSFGEKKTKTITQIDTQTKSKNKRKITQRHTNRQRHRTADDAGPTTLLLLLAPAPVAPATPAAGTLNIFTCVRLFAIVRTACK